MGSPLFLSVLTFVDLTNILPSLERCVLPLSFSTDSIARFVMIVGIIVELSPEPVQLVGSFSQIAKDLNSDALMIKVQDYHQAISFFDSVMALQKIAKNDALLGSKFAHWAIDSLWFTCCQTCSKCPPDLWQWAYSLDPVYFDQAVNSWIVDNGCGNPHRLFAGIKQLFDIWSDISIPQVSFHHS